MPSITSSTNPARTMSVAMVQLNSRDDVAANQAAAFAGIDAAAAAGARLVVLPEVWTYLGPDAGQTAAAEPVPGPLTARLGEKARQHGIYVHAGSILERVEGESRLFNTSVVFDPAGAIIATYRKIHLFDVDLDADTSYRESDTIAPGEVIVTFDLDGTTVGLAICYDLRFADLFRAMSDAGATILSVPAAFTVLTGQAHWHVLLRARAIEAGAFVVAAAQTGVHDDGRATYGHSLVIDPWGKVLLDMGEAAGIGFVDIDPDQVAAVRARVPVLDHRRPIPPVERLP